jgi:hypothetical protein
MVLYWPFDVDAKFIRSSQRKVRVSQKFFSGKNDIRIPILQNLRLELYEMDVPHLLGLRL